MVKVHKYKPKKVEKKKTRLTLFLFATSNPISCPILIRNTELKRLKNC
jgi:hypothetical protein